MPPWSTPGKSSLGFQNASTWKENPPAYHQAGRNTYRFKFRECLCGHQGSENEEFSIPQTRLLGEEVNSWAQAPRLNRPARHQLPLTRRQASWLNQAQTPLCLVFWGFCLSKRRVPRWRGLREPPQRSSCRHTFPESGAGNTGTLPELI